MPIKKIILEKANRLFRIPPEVNSFFRIEKKRTLIKRTEYIDLLSFNWNCSFDEDFSKTTESLMPAGRESIMSLKEELAGWYLKTDKVRLNPKSEIYIGGGISSSLQALSTAFIDPGDIVFVPEISIPLYRRVTYISGGEPITYSVNAVNNWQPDFEKVNSPLGRVAKFLILNSPHNPTGAALKSKDYEYLVWLAAKENIAIINDAAYRTLSGSVLDSFLSVKGSMKTGVEVSSFSYLFGLPAMNFGFVAGNKDLINGLKETDRFNGHQIPAYFVNVALDGIRQFPGKNLKEIKSKFQKSAAEADRLLEILSLESYGFNSIPFIWAKIKKRSRAVNAANILKRRSQILSLPGNILGNSGEGYLRFSLTASAESYQQAIKRTKCKLKLLKLDREE